MKHAVLTAALGLIGTMAAWAQDLPNLPIEIVQGDNRVSVTATEIRVVSGDKSVLVTPHKIEVKAGDQQVVVTPPVVDKKLSVEEIR